MLGGLGLFLFALINLSDTLKGLMGDKASKWLNYFTKLNTPNNEEAS